MLGDMIEGEQNKAHAFADFAATHQWDVEIRRITHRDYPDKRYRQAGWTVIARRGADVVTATWIDEVAIGPIGWHSTPSAQQPIPNQASVRRIVES
jgi:hypothetical protein